LEESVKGLLKTILWIMAIFLSGALLTQTLSLMSEKDEFSYWFGLFGTVVIVLVWVFVTIKKGKEFFTMLKNKRSIGTLGVLLAAALVSSVGSGCTRVGPAEAGIKVSLAGSARGVADIPLVTGWVPYNPFATSVITFPTFVQTASWTRDTTEGANKNEEITFNSKEGLVISGDISVSYSIIRDSVPKFYVRFKMEDLDAFTHGFVRNIARDAFNEIGVNYKVEEIYGEKKGELLSNVREFLNSELNPYGVHIEQFGFLHALRYPDGVTQALNAKITATQKAIQAENELRETEAQAKKAVAKAEGESQANLTLAKSITPELIKWRQLQLTEAAIAKWNGNPSMVQGGTAGQLLLNMPLPTNP
jgi:regulator of protease activity HflC (stomatin/prohibitin superfamily)